MRCVGDTLEEKSECVDWIGTIESVFFGLVVPNDGRAKIDENLSGLWPLLKPAAGYIG